MRITVPDEIMRLTVPTCTPSRDNPLVIVSSLEVGGPDLHILSVGAAGRLSERLAPRAPQADWPGSVAQAVRTRLQLQRSDKRV